MLRSGARLLKMDIIGVKKGKVMKIDRDMNEVGEIVNTNGWFLKGF